MKLIALRTALFPISDLRSEGSVLPGEATR